MKTKKLVALLMALLMIGLTAGAAAETGRVINLDLDAATDEELVDAAAQIKAEQQARLKTAIRFDPEEVAVAQGTTKKVTATVVDLPDGAKAGKFTWTSSNEAVATCTNGVIKGTGAGNAVITCTNVLSDGTEVFAELNVTGYVLVKTLTFADKKLELMAGDAYTPEMKITPENATDKTYTLKSSDEKIVRVDENGQLVAVLNGKATITATANDGSGKKAALNVTVTKKIGKYDDELTFQDIAWGSSAEEVAAKLKEAGLLAADRDAWTYNTNWIHYWPEKDLLFAHSNSWQELPVAFQDQGKGAAQMSIEPQKKIGGYTPDYVYFYFLNPVGENNEVDKEKTELAGIYIQYDNKHERGAEIFVDLLAKLEGQYGEFTRYLAKDLTRNYYKDMYNIIKTSMTGAKQYKYRELGKDTYLSDYAFCVLRGKNNTGIVLMVNSSEYVTLFYGKTDALEKIADIQKALEAIPDDKEDAGL